MDETNLEVQFTEDISDSQEAIELRFIKEYKKAATTNMNSLSQQQSKSWTTTSLSTFYPNYSGIGNIALVNLLVKFCFIYQS